MKLQRAIGQTSQILLLFVQDVTATTGAGLANVIGSSVSYTWFHNTQVSVTTGTASTAGTTGTFSTSAWVMISSSNALGWYQFGAPDGVFSTGDCVGIHFYGAPNMVPLPVEIELVRDNPLQFSSSKTFLSYSSTSPANVTQAVGQPIVTSGAGILNVSTQSLSGITVSTQTLATTSFANLVQIYSQPAVTSGSGILNVSTQTVDKTGYLVNVTSFSAAITTNANVIQAYGAAIVTSASGQFRVSTQSLVGITVSTQTIDKGGYGVTTNADKLNYDITSTYGTALVTSGAGILNVSTQTLAAGAGDIISVYGVPIVTSGAGILRVSTQAIDKGGYGVTTNADKGGYGVTTNADKTAYALTAGERAAIMNVFNTTVVPESYRVVSTEATVTQMMYELLGNITNIVNSGTVRLLGSVTSGSLVATYQYDSTTPSSITRIS